MIRNIIVVDETDGVSSKGMILRRWARANDVKCFTSVKEASEYLLKPIKK